MVGGRPQADRPTSLTVGTPLPGCPDRRAQGWGTPGDGCPYKRIPSKRVGAAASRPPYGDYHALHLGNGTEAVPYGDICRVTGGPVRTNVSRRGDPCGRPGTHHKWWVAAPSRPPYGDYHALHLGNGTEAVAYCEILPTCKKTAPGTGNGLF